jgi:16S rRNA (guanine527-N7)-methyltransferase
MEVENKKLFIEGAKSFGIDLGETDIEAFDLYIQELFKWNQKINLTAIRTERGIVLKHFLDSLSVYPYLPHTSTLLDIGSGAGFPGIPLKIVRPSLQVTLIDSVLKKVNFQRHIIRKLALKGIKALQGRVQDKEVLQRMERQFDMIISRAFTDLRTLMILSFPFLKERGTVIAMKGEVSHQEAQLSSEIEGIPYRLQKRISLTLPASSFKRTILLFEKGSFYAIN